MPADWNALGVTLHQSFCRTESAARKLANKLAREYDAPII
jgi:hypothetical protein